MVSLMCIAKERAIVLGVINRIKEAWEKDGIMYEYDSMNSTELSFPQNFGYQSTVNACGRFVMSLF